MISQQSEEREDQSVENYYEKEQQITAAFSDRRCELDIYHATLLFQDAMTELFHQYRCDAVRMSKTHGAVWAVARSKFRYEGLPVWSDRVRVRAFPVKVTAVTIHINIQVETLEGQPLLLCRQELCAIDVNDHSLRRVETTPFPRDLSLLPPVMTEPFQRKKLALGEEHLGYRHIIRTSDTDMNHHMNNAAYVRLLLDAFPSAFWDAHPIRTFDIHYVSEGQEGEEIGIFHDHQGQNLDFQIKSGDRTLIKAHLELAESGS